MSDLISRKQAIDAIPQTSVDAFENCRYCNLLDRGQVIDIIKSLPSAEQKTGKWVLDPNGMDWNIPAWRCSECGFVANYIGVEANGFGSNPMNWVGSKFCPNCGAKMKGGDTE